MALPALRGHGPLVPAATSSAAPRRTSFPWLQALVLGCVLVVFVATVTEIGLRVADLRASNLAGLQCLGSGTLLQGQKGLYVLDASAGYDMRPNTCVRLKTSEYDGVLRTNGRGIVGPEVAATKPAGEFRVVVLGDSYTVGGQVPYEQTFPAVLERRLRDAGHGNVRVINAGVGGYTTFNEAGLLREHLAWMQPDLVIVATFLGNDVSENVLATAAGYRDAPEHPKGVTWGLEAARLVDDSGAWFARNNVATSTALPPPWDPTQLLPRPVGNHPAPAMVALPVTQPLSAGQQARTTLRGVWDALRSNSLLLGKLFGVPVDPSVSTAPGSAAPAVEQERLNLTSFEWTILRDIPLTYWLDVAWPLYGQYLADARATAANAGAPLVVLAIPEMSQFDEHVRARVMANYRFREEEVDWDKPQRDLASRASTAGVPVLDLLPQFRALADRADLYLRIDTHFSAYGHTVTAEALMTFLQEGGYLPPVRS